MGDILRIVNKYSVVETEQIHFPYNNLITSFDSSLSNPNCFFIHRYSQCNAIIAFIFSAF